MKHFILLCLFFLIAFIAVPFITSAQRAAETAGHRSGNIHSRLEHAYKEGKLTLEKKILYQFYVLNDPKQLPSEYRMQHPPPIKCGTPLIMEYYNNRSQLSQSAVNKIQSMMGFEARAKAETYISPSGKFEIHYETDGENSVPAADINPENDIPDYVDKVAAAADSSYRHEIQNLDYPDPLLPNQRYEIEILNLSFYGQTIIDDESTLIQIENDFSENFPSNTDPDGDQTGAIKVTMAHEFKHAIQYEINKWDGETDEWTEMDATLMEEVVYDNVNDYYNYLINENAIFNNPLESFYPGTYYHVSWALFFEEKLGPDFWPAVWKIIENEPDINFTDAMIQQLGGVEIFYQNYVKSQLWHYSSGESHSIPAYGFEESEFYPDSDINQLFLDRDTLSNPTAIPGFAASYNELEPVTDRDGFLTVSINYNHHLGGTGIGLIASFKDGSYESRVKVLENLDGQSGSQTVETSWKWNDINYIGIILANGGNEIFSDYFLSFFPSIPEEITLDQNYPNPFRPAAGTTIEFSLSEDSDIELKVYDVTGKLVTTLIDERRTAGFYDDITFRGNNLASGVYFYQLITDQRTLVKAMTLIK